MDCTSIPSTYNYDSAFDFEDMESQVMLSAAKAVEANALWMAGAMTALAVINHNINSL